MGRKSTERAVAAIASTLLIMVYLGLLGSFLIRIRCFQPGPDGAALVLYVILTIKAGDIGAYLTGRFLGKHPLIAWLSPKKTIEGFAGAIVLSCVVASVGEAIWALKGPKLIGSPPLHLSQAIIFGALMAFTGHLGDLAESLIKRDMGVKHSAHMIPAFGGLLDVFDSLLFAGPVAWWLLTTFAKTG